MGTDEIDTGANTGAVAGSRAAPPDIAKIALRITALYFLVRGIESVVTVFSFADGVPGSIQTRIAAAVGPVAGAILWFAADVIAPRLSGSNEAFVDDSPTRWDPEATLRVSFAVVGAVFGVRGLILIIQSIGQLQSSRYGGPAGSAFSSQVTWVLISGAVEMVAGAALAFGTGRLAAAIHRMRYGTPVGNGRRNDEPDDEEVS